MIVYMIPGQWYLSGTREYGIDDDERPGRPTEIGDAMFDDIRHAVQEDGRITVREISESFDLSVSTIHTIFDWKTKIRMLSLRWAPRLLKEDELKERVRASNAFLYRTYATACDFISEFQCSGSYCIAMYNWLSWSCFSYSITLMFTLSREIIFNYWIIVDNSTEYNASW